MGTCTTRLLLLLLLPLLGCGGDGSGGPGSPDDTSPGDWSLLTDGAVDATPDTPGGDLILDHMAPMDLSGDPEDDGGPPPELLEQDTAADTAEDTEPPPVPASLRARFPSAMIPAGAVPGSHRIRAAVGIDPAGTMAGGTHTLLLGF
ncbi:MAG: hypothetical protein FJ098_12005 [Deltaproteobacteria bacterium]|nr:hypothetical protein [Deltaproteobacteria bacterium]